MTSPELRAARMKSIAALRDAANAKLAEVSAVFDLFHQREGAAAEAIAGDRRASLVPTLLGVGLLVRQLPEPPAGFNAEAALHAAYGDTWRSMFANWPRHVSAGHAPRLAHALVQKKSFLTSLERDSKPAPAVAQTPATIAPIDSVRTNFAAQLERKAAREKAARAEHRAAISGEDSHLRAINAGFDGALAARRRSHSPTAASAASQPAMGRDRLAANFNAALAKPAELSTHDAAVNAGFDAAMRRRRARQ